MEGEVDSFWGVNIPFNSSTGSLSFFPAVVFLNQELSLILVMETGLAMANRAAKRGEAKGAVGAVCNALDSSTFDIGGQLHFALRRINHPPWHRKLWSAPSA